MGGVVLRRHRRSRRGGPSGQGTFGGRTREPRRHGRHQGRDLLPGQVLRYLQKDKGAEEWPRHSDRRKQERARGSEEGPVLVEPPERRRKEADRRGRQELSGRKSQGVRHGRDSFHIRHDGRQQGRHAQPQEPVLRRADRAVVPRGGPGRRVLQRSSDPSYIRVHLHHDRRDLHGSFDGVLQGAEVYHERHADGAPDIPARGASDLREVLQHHTEDAEKAGPGQAGEYPLRREPLHEQGRSQRREAYRQKDHGPVRRQYRHVHRGRRESGPEGARLLPQHGHTVPAGLRPDGDLAYGRAEP